MTEKFLTRKEVSKKLKVSERTLKTWQYEGTLPAYKLGGTVRYKESEVTEAFVRVSKKEVMNG